MKRTFTAILCILALCLPLTFASCSAAPSTGKNPMADERLDDGMRTALGTLRQVDDKGKLYEMDVTFDYYGAAMQKIMEDENYVKHDHGCTVFLTHNEAGEVITCRNFDTNHQAKIIEDAEGVYIVYYCHPEGKYSSVAIGDAKYCGDTAAQYHPGALNDGSSDISMMIRGIFDVLDGINEKGLSVAVMSSDKRPDEETYSRGDPEKDTVVVDALLRLMLDECATVEEAVSLAGKYNVMPYTGSKKIDHVFVSDAAGASKVIEWRYNEMRVADTDISTNFFQTWEDPEPHKVKTSKQQEVDSQLTKTYKDYQYGYGHGYDRFNMVASTLQQYAEFDENGTYSTRLTDELARNLLSLVAQQHTPEMTSMTQYSVIYNQSALTADVWLSRDYSKKYTFKVR